MRIAALDLGSNTTILLVADVEDGRITRVVRDETNVTRMGQGVHADRKFHPEALARVTTTLEGYAKLIKADGCARVIAVATSAARDVTNAAELIEIGRRFDIPIHIIPGGREAELTFRGAPGTPGSSVIDVGGGSTEIISEVSGQIRGVSVDVGSVRLSELFVTTHPIPSDELARARAYADRAFAAANLPRSGAGEVIAVAGSPTTLAALDAGRDFDESFVHGYRLSRGQIGAWIERLAGMSIAERERLPGMQPKRADVIVIGAVLLASALDALDQDEIRVSTRGVRYGVAHAWEEF